MARNNSIALLACITSVATSSTNFGVTVYVVGFLDPFVKDPSSCTNLLRNPNSNGYPSTDRCLLTGTYSFGDLNSPKEVYVSTFFVLNLAACKPPCVYCCYCCKRYCKC
jgi:hypothetical protein